VPEVLVIGLISDEDLDPISAIDKRLKVVDGRGLFDSEIKEIISEQYARALEILREKKGILEKGAHLLLEKEKIEGDEIKALMEGTS